MLQAMFVKVTDQDHICHAHYSESWIDIFTVKTSQDLFGIGFYNLRKIRVEFNLVVLIHVIINVKVLVNYADTMLHSL